MRRTKMQKGITLIALIITIIILLILAVVTIGAIQESKIIAHAKNASTTYNNEKSKEESAIAGYEALIESKLPGGNGGSKVTYKEGVPIPSGFYYVTGTKDTGFVISDNPADENNASGKSGNQFVWIPVPENEFSSFAVLQDGSTEDYRGVLYNWSSNSTYSWSSTSTSYREPANLTGTKKWSSATTVNGKQVAAGTEYVYDGTDMFNLFDMGTYSETYYQDKFNDMVASVAKYGGFYVGRYETSLSGNIAQSKAGQPVMNNIEWYKMYKYSEAYSQSGVISEMIWGCQWDAMMRFIGSRATESGNVSHDLIEPYKTGGTDYTGTVTYNDISKNIYDLEGNVFEWTQEANNTSYRVYRGRLLQQQQFA